MTTPVGYNKLCICNVISTATTKELYKKNNKKLYTQSKWKCKNSEANWMEIRKGDQRNEKQRGKQKNQTGRCEALNIHNYFKCKWSTCIS